jgi:geranylgeranyl diphosphate synthase type II
MKPNAPDILGHWADALTAYFRQVLKRYPEAPPRLMEAIEYSLLAGGKRLRPALILECWRACGSTAAQPAPAALAAAAAMELIHTFSLVHDDLPAMDDDDLRRGRPTNHKVFGEAVAILAGDAMVTMAFEVLADDAPADLVPALVRELASASGPSGMIGGQVIDIDSKSPPANLPELQRLHRMKTGALLTASWRTADRLLPARRHRRLGPSRHAHRPRPLRPPSRPGLSDRGRSARPDFNG